MKLKSYLVASSLLIFVLFTGCSKEVEEYNKPAIYWYFQIVEQVSKGNLDRADSSYSSLQGEHIGSPLLPEATMILAIAHMHHEEYLLSEYFLDEYIKRYATSNEKQEAEFLKIKAKYMALPNPRRDQALIDETIKDGEQFKLNYPNSMYEEVVDTMLSKLYLAQSAFNEAIVSLYERIDKPKSAAYYRSTKDDSWINWDDIERAEAPWYRAWFEGDGTSSWYEFMLPDTKSVVSRNSIQDEYEMQEVELKEDDKSKKISVFDPFSSKSEEVKKAKSKKEDKSSWYDMFNPFSESDYEVKDNGKSKKLEVFDPLGSMYNKTKKSKPKEEKKSDWYDAINPFSESDDEARKGKSKKENKSYWYDILNPFSDSDNEVEKVKPKKNYKSKELDVFDPFSSNNDLKKETHSHEA